MKRLLILPLIVSLSSHAMGKSQAEPVAGESKPGKAGFFTDALNFAASPIAAGAEKVAKEAMESMAQYKQKLVVEIVAGVAAANQDQMKALQEKIDKLQKTVEAQNKSCCSVQ